MRNDARARFELSFQLRFEPSIDGGGQKEGDDGGLGEIGLEEIGLDEGDMTGEVGLARVPGRLLDELRVDLDAPRAPYFWAAVMTIRPSPDPRS